LAKWIDFRSPAGFCKSVPAVRPFSFLFFFSANAELSKDDEEL
jgi:hypothetical protein